MAIELLHGIKDFLPDLTGQTVLLLGDISQGRETLLNQYIIDSLRNGDVVLIVSLTKSMQDIINEISQDTDAGMTINEAILNEKFYVIDAFSFRVGIEDEREEIPGVIHLEMPDDLTTLSIYINEVTKQHQNVRIIIQPFSLLVLYNKLHNILGFTQSLVARTRARNHSAILIVDEGVLTTYQYSAFKSIVDTILELKTIEDQGPPKFSLRIPFTRSGKTDLKWKEYARVI